MTTEQTVEIPWIHLGLTAVTVAGPRMTWTQEGAQEPAGRLNAKPAEMKQAASLEIAMLTCDQNSMEETTRGHRIMQRLQQARRMSLQEQERELRAVRGTA